MVRSRPIVTGRKNAKAPGRTNDARSAAGYQSLRRSNASAESRMRQIGRRKHICGSISTVWSLHSMRSSMIKVRTEAHHVCRHKRKRRLVLFSIHSSTCTKVCWHTHTRATDHDQMTLTLMQYHLKVLCACYQTSTWTLQALPYCHSRTT